MWRMGLVVLVLAAVGSRAAADEIYRWTDKAGAVHISNAPSVGDRKTTVESESMPNAPGEPTAAVQPEAMDPRATAGTAPGQAAVPVGASETSEEHAAYSSDVSLRRNALERDLRATESRLHQIDAELAGLARARTQYARGTAGTGGLGTNAAEARSPQELVLDVEREKLSKHASETRASGAKLRDEVTQRLGTTPDWWRDLR